MADSRSLIECLAEVEDYRDPRGVRYRLKDLIFMMICAVVCGCRDAVEIVTYIGFHLKEFRELLGIRSVPSHDTISRVYIHTDWVQLTAKLSQWLRENYPQQYNLYCGRKAVHIDGKAIRSSAAKADGEKPPYLLNSMTDGGPLDIGGMPVGDKDNEITAIPKLLDMLDIAGAIVTIDAIGTQRAIMEKILSKDGHYLLHVKEKQKALLESIKAEEKRLSLEGKLDSLPKCRLTRNEHGRCEIITLTVIENTGFLMDDFKPDDTFMTIGRAAVMRKDVIMKKTGEKSSSVSYLITDLCDIDPENFLGIKLSHWNVEMGHWRLDVQLDEDHQRQRLGNSRPNSSAFRRLLLWLAKDPKHPKMTARGFQIRCQSDFRWMVSELFGVRDKDDGQGKT